MGVRRQCPGPHSRRFSRVRIRRGDGCSNKRISVGFFPFSRGGIIVNFLFCSTNKLLTLSSPVMLDTDMDKLDWLLLPSDLKLQNIYSVSGGG